MKVSFNGYDESVTTFEAADGVTAGCPVKMVGNGKVGPCTAKEAFCGIALSVRNGFAAVQLKGFYGKLAFSGSDMAVGAQKLGAAANKVEVASAGRECLVVEVDNTASTCGIIL